MLLSFSTGGMFMKVAATFHPELCTDTTLTSAEKHDTDCKDRANISMEKLKQTNCEKKIIKNAKSGKKNAAANFASKHWQMATVLHLVLAEQPIQLG